MFSTLITDHWNARFFSKEVLHASEAFTLAISPDLAEEERVSLLETGNGHLTAVLTPAMADKAEISRGASWSAAAFRHALRDAGIALHGADLLFYFPESGREALLRAPSEGISRQLTPADAAIFAEFESQATELDLDAAYVALDHWAAFGAFDGEHLACVASMYPWGGAKLADTGVLTLAPSRGKGLARQAVRAISRHAYAQGHEPQYRCQFDNLPSRALAEAAGMAVFGKWEVISPDCEA